MGGLIVSYLYSCFITIKEGMSFRIDFIIRFLTGFLYNYANVAIIYYIMLANVESLDVGLFNTSLNYIIFSATLSAAVFFSVQAGEITRKVVTGDIAREILYPYTFLIALFFQCLGRFLSIIINRLIPSIIILTLIFRPVWTMQWERIIGFLVLVFIGYTIYFLISTIIDLMSFWRQETYYFHFIKEGLFLILSGSTIPMWFYPDLLFTIATYLPFKWMIYGPISYLLGEMSNNEYLIILGAMLAWLLLFIGIASFIWKRGVKKVVVFGG